MGFVGTSTLGFGRGLCGYLHLVKDDKLSVGILRERIEEGPRRLRCEGGWKGVKVDGSV